MHSIIHLKRQVDRIANQIPQPVIIDLSTQEKIASMSAQQKAKYAAQLGLEGLFELASKKRMRPDDHLQFIKAMTLYQEVLDSPSPRNGTEVMDFSSFSEDELRAYAKLEERAKKVKKT